MPICEIDLEVGGAWRFVWRNEMPPQFPWPEAPDEPQLVSPGAIDPDMLKYFAKKLE